jgi:hypothetical protein
MTDTPIDAEYVLTFRTKSYIYAVQQLIPFTSVLLAIVITDVLGNVISNSTLELVGDSYNAWGNDDTYLDDCVSTEVKRILNLP